MGDDDGEARRRVRQLLLSGDNTRKNRQGPERDERARARYAEAREVATAAGLEPALIAIIDARLEDLAGAAR